MRVLLVVPDTNIGGITTSAVNLSNELISRGLEVCFLDMSGEYACADHLSEKVGRYSLKGKSRLWNVGKKTVDRTSGLRKMGRLSVGAVKKLTIRSGLWYRMIFSRFDQYGEFDVAIAFRQCDPCYSFVLHKVPAKKKIGFVHGELKYMGDISSWKRHMTKFHKIAYVSNAVREEFVTAYPELEKNACTIYNTFDVERINAMANENCNVVFDKSKVNIVTVARLTRQKQIDWVLHICNKILNQCNRQFHWYIVGDGYLSEELREKSTILGVNDVVTFTGSLDNPYPLIKNASFTVLPSTCEAFGMVVIESFILKVPAVVTKYGALKEIMENGRYGLISEQNMDDLCDRVVSMIENRGGIANEIKDRMLEYRYSNDNAYKQFIDAINGNT